jgi:hypothetical protein
MLLSILVVVGIFVAIMLAWAIETRPSSWQVRNELYELLCMTGAVIVFFVFVGIASNYFLGPDWLWGIVGFIGLFWMALLIHEKFNSSQSRSRL